MVRNFHRLVFIVGVTGLLALVFWPYHDGVLQYGLPLSLAAVWISSLAFLWRRKFARVVLLALPVLAAVPFLLPAKPIPADQLRDRYLTSMRAMEGADYVWGGERHRGVDCSGLPRLALRDALLQEAWKNANGAAFRKWSEQWWFDTSAKALGENYRGFTRPTGVRGKLRDLDPVILTPGDLGISVGGRHVMIYFGDGKWIQADPASLKVTFSDPATDPNPWFDSIVVMRRWSLLDSGKSRTPDLQVKSARIAGE